MSASTLEIPRNYSKNFMNMHLRGAAAGLVRQVLELDEHDALQAQ
jgi:hypothetical protein